MNSNSNIISYVLAAMALLFAILYFTKPSPQFDIPTDKRIDSLLIQLNDQAKVIQRFNDEMSERAIEDSLKSAEINKRIIKLNSNVKATMDSLSFVIGDLPTFTAD